MINKHFNNSSIQKFVDGDYPFEQIVEISSHIAQCTKCKEKLEEVSPTFIEETPEINSFDEHLNPNDMRSWLKKNFPIIKRLEISDHIRNCPKCKYKFYEQNLLSLEGFLVSSYEEKSNNKKGFYLLVPAVALTVFLISLVSLLSYSYNYNAPYSIALISIEENAMFDNLKPTSSKFSRKKDYVSKKQLASNNFNKRKYSKNYQSKKIDKLQIKKKNNEFEKWELNKQPTSIKTPLDSNILPKANPISEKTFITSNKVKSIINTQDTTLDNNLVPQQIMKLPTDFKRVDHYIASNRNYQTSEKFDGININNTAKVIYKPNASQTQQVTKVKNPQFKKVSIKTYSNKPDVKSASQKSNRDKIMKFFESGKDSEKRREFATAILFYKKSLKLSHKAQSNYRFRNLYELGNSNQKLNRTQKACEKWREAIEYPKGVDILSITYVKTKIENKCNKQAKLLNPQIGQ